MMTRLSWARTPGRPKMHQNTTSSQLFIYHLLLLLLDSFFLVHSSGYVIYDYANLSSVTDWLTDGLAVYPSSSFLLFQIERNNNKCKNILIYCYFSSFILAFIIANANTFYVSIYSHKCNRMHITYSRYWLSWAGICSIQINPSINQFDAKNSARPNRTIRSASRYEIHLIWQQLNISFQEPIDRLSLKHQIVHVLIWFPSNSIPSLLYDYTHQFQSLFVYLSAIHLFVFICLFWMDFRLKKMVFASMCKCTKYTYIV